MNSNRPPTPPARLSPGPAKPNPFVDAQPARIDPFEQPLPATRTWGPYEHAEIESDAPRGDERALEILITWGDSVLHVAHLNPPRPFAVGDAGAEQGVDFHLPEQVLGRSRLELVTLQDGVPHLLAPDIAKGRVEVDEAEHDLRDYLENVPLCPTATRAKAVALTDDLRATLELGEFCILVRVVAPSTPIDKGLLSNLDWAVPSYFGMTSATLGAFMGALAYFVPPLGLEDESSIDKDRLVAIGHYLDAASEREQREPDRPDTQPGAEPGGKSAEKAPGEAGAAGKEDGPKQRRRVAVKGPRDNPQPQLSRREALALAEDFGVIGILNSAIASDPHAPKSVFGRDVSLGRDDVSANGQLWADAIGDSIGGGALSLFGPGPGGGFGDGTGIGISNISGGLLGPGHGKEGWGRSAALTEGGHEVRSPNPVRTGRPSVSGRIPPQVVQRIVRQNFGRFRMCYQQGLAKNPSLEGRIPVRFVIGRDGSVSNVGSAGGFPDSRVQSCVTSAFYGLSFPPPEGGVVKVTYPLIFSPG